MEALLQLLATFSCAVFSGAAIYVNLVEHPARMSCGTELAIAEWVPSYKRATIMQASLAILGFVFAVSAWIMGSSIWWLTGAIVFGLVVPFTLVSIAPTNKRLASQELDKSSNEAHRLLRKWGNLHAVRSILSTIALVIFLLNL